MIGKSTFTGQPVLGAILAGGQSRRFGSDKALALVAGKPLIEHAIDSISRHVSSVVVCGRAMADHISLCDRPNSGLGPLGGLCAALHYAVAKKFRGVLTTACDTPFLPDGTGRQLIGPSANVFEGQWLIGYWPVELASLLDTHLSSSADRSMHSWIGAANATVVACPETVANINTHDDLTILAATRVKGCPAES